MRTQTHHAIEAIAEERERQISEEGYDAHYDDFYSANQLGYAAACYAAGTRVSSAGTDVWPWDEKHWKPRTARENLVRAGALIVAELERLERIGQ
jgi:hypothetical protein